ncbi:nicotinamide n-methyltransferase [Verticillium alfalfae VaMs.102]|uniref:Nicotinamide n-methyltransferase n=1 Tax=Verticillium alfalfae (strain VaMs.102 / ATCC MYA-4576 / FGSC 10136) TaxID=526221 RepID=C9ST86_VERA1|nr:nicotinamide n-methyltransferase [Verticillium alfalfae VaMs.102]EEY22001.1 nicotinamide n-methyltransferase [Verticillium alfalfae VaMs.102]
MQKNIDVCEGADEVVAKGYVWGADPAPLLAELPEPEAKFDVLILADLLFRHSEHKTLVKTIDMTLSKKKESRAYVFFTSYRPWLRHKDLVFFDAAREKGFLVEQVIDRKMEKKLFENDPGDEEVLKTVSGYELRWPESECEL